uniref:Uncharacterized protein n=1 Tax=Phlebotomus papatasi TaxID=29031 RepID=A0A1B0D971_PHLPP
MSSDDKCQLCSKEKAKYSCPRCNILYCSVPCYRCEAHLQCSESFYKQCIEEELASNASNQVSESAKKMHEILKRMQDLEDPGDDIEEIIPPLDGSSGESDLDSDDDTPESDLAARLEGVDLNDPEAVWSKLTSTERQEFESIVHAGDISSLVPMYTPWWVENQEKLVQEVQLPGTPATSHPEILSDIKPFRDISSKPPAPCVRHNLTNILASYAFSVKYFNGEFLAHPQEFSGFLVSICGNIKNNSNYASDALAVESVAHEARNEGVPVDKEDVLMMKEDVEMIQKGQGTLAALSDIHRILLAAKKAKGEEKKSAKGPFSKRFVDPQGREFKDIEKSRIGVYIKKIDFFLAYAKDVL